MYTTLTHANTLFICTCRFLSLWMTIIVIGTYVSLILEKDLYIYWTLCKAQLVKSFEQKMLKCGIVSYSFYSIMIVFNVILLGIVLKITDVKIQLCNRLQALISCWVFWRKTSILIVLPHLNWNHPSRILNKIMGRYQIVLVHMDNYSMHFSNCRILTIFIFQVWL